MVAQLGSGYSVQVFGQRVDEHADLGGKAAVARIERVHIHGVVLILRQ